MKTKVLLYVKCRQMKNPNMQRTHFDQTLGSNSWMLQENQKPIIHDNGSVTTASVWGRVFSGRKTQEEIDRITRNLIKRAAKYAEIDDYSMDLEFETIHSPDQEFRLAPVLFSED